MTKPNVKCNLISEGILTFVSLPTKCAFYSKKLIQIFCSCQPSLWMTPKPDIKASPIIYANPCTGLTSGIFLCSRRGIISRIAVGILICFVLWLCINLFLVGNMLPSRCPGSSYWPYFALSCLVLLLNSISYLLNYSWRIPMTMTYCEYFFRIL